MLNGYGTRKENCAQVLSSDAGGKCTVSEPMRLDWYFLRLSYCFIRGYVKNNPQFGYNISLGLSHWRLLIRPICGNIAVWAWAWQFYCWCYSVNMTAPLAVCTKTKQREICWFSLIRQSLVQDIVIWEEIKFQCPIASNNTEVYCDIFHCSFAYSGKIVRSSVQV